jgi:nicotinate-nucleotide adenylyltransferase
VRLGIFGGSFDPIHHGHLIAAQLAHEALGLDRVLLMVSGAQPLKGGHGAAAVHRLRMAELAVEGIAALAADGREIARDGASYTVDTLRSLRAEWPGSELVLLLGSDAAAAFDRWREPEAIRALARVVVFARGATTVPAGFEAMPLPRMDLSSTEIRGRAALGLSLRGWVPERVADYISGLALYQRTGGAG